VKIGFVTENYYPTVGGIQEHVRSLAAWHLAQGHDYRIITGMPTVSQWRGPRDDERVLRVGKARRYGVMGTFTQATIGPGIALRLAGILRREKFDVLHLHNPADFGIQLLAHSMFSGPIVATWHTTFKQTASRKFLAPYYRWVLKKMDALIGVSDLAVDTMRRFADLPYKVIPNGVDVAAFTAGKPLPQFHDGSKNIVYLGRLEPRNGPDLLLEAMPAIVAAVPNARLIVAGSGPNGHADHEQSVPASVRDRVTFLGSIENETRADLLATGNVFVVPARRGGTFSILVLEGLAAGLPVVSTPFVDVQHRDSHWAPVMLTRDFTPAAIAERIIEALSEDQSARIAHGREVVAEYDWARVSPQVHDVFREAIEARRA
jgi:phosphatidyl-myo-inositol alpha-mannosyltransferase